MLVAPTSSCDLDYGSFGGRLLAWESSHSSEDDNPKVIDRVLPTHERVTTLELVSLPATV